MTVLTRYQRLECPGTWRDAGAAQRRNVYVSLGEATLVISDGTDAALTHWSLPAVERVNPGQRPALYRPGPDAEERLEIDDPEMIEAIATVGRAVAGTRPRPGRLRRGAFAAVLLGIAGLGAFWLPAALVDHAASVLPEATRAEIGRRILDGLQPVAGRPCRDRDGRRALAALQSRLFGAAPWQIAVLPGGPAPAAGLPGGILLLHRSLVEDPPTPEAAGGALLTEAARMEGSDPMRPFLQAAGPWATLRLLTTGRIDPAVVDAYAREVLIAAVPMPEAGRLQDRFRAAGLSTAPYRRTGPPAPIAALLAAHDPFPDGSPEPLLGDGDWQRLQGICGG